MRAVFWGSPAFAVATLEALLESRHEVAGVVTRPPRPKGRGRKPAPTPVARVAEASDLPVLAPEKPRGESFLGRLADLGADACVVAAYGEILRPEVLGMPLHGAINVHASLLPRWRGAAPVTRAILAGDRVTGVTIMRMDEGLDTGPILLQREEPIRADDTAGSLTDRLAGIGADLLVEALDRLEAGEIVETPQDDALATYAPKVGSEEAELDWARPAAELARAARAFDPWPGAWTTWRGERLKVYRLEPASRSAGFSDVVSGTIVGVDPPRVAAGEGTLALAEVQPAGGGRMGGAAWARGRDVEPGGRLGE